MALVRCTASLTLQPFVPTEALLASLPRDISNEFHCDYELAQKAVQAGVSSGRSRSADTHWEIWTNFCSSLAIDPLLENIADPISLLQVFAHRYRTGALAPRQKQVHSRTVEDALHSVGQAFSGMGAPDPWLTAQGKIDFRIQRQLRCYSKQDPPPNRVKPIPIPVLRSVLAVALCSEEIGNMATADMVVLAFFFLLRPGEYTGGTSDTTPFRFCDVQLFVGQRRLDLSSATTDQILSATFATLEFTTQKNGVRGEVIGLARSGDPHLCPVLTLLRRIIHARDNNIPFKSPLASYKDNTGRLHYVMPLDVTASLKLAVHTMGPSLGFLDKDISARSLRAAGAMALLCAHVDSDTIRLLGRWRSDEMLRYLHVQAVPVMRDFAQRMLTHGSFTFLPNSEVPSF